MMPSSTFLEVINITRMNMHNYVLIGSEDSHITIIFCLINYRIFSNLIRTRFKVSEG
jgi:hypothetical protein